MRKNEQNEQNDQKYQKQNKTKINDCKKSIDKKTTE